jgi:excisionase family DNA binding protein
MDNQTPIAILTPDQIREIVKETVVQALKDQKQVEAPQARKTMNVDEVAAFTGLTKNTIYIKTMRGLIPHYKRDKRVFFDRDEVEAWLMENKRITSSEAEKQADKYLAQKASRQKR